jgi:hypothetical protein
MKAEGGKGGCCHSSSGYRGGCCAAPPGIGGGCGVRPPGLGCGVGVGARASRPRLRVRRLTSAAGSGRSPGLAALAAGSARLALAAGSGRSRPRGLGCGVCHGLGGPDLGSGAWLRLRPAAGLFPVEKIIHTQLNQKPTSQELIVN